MKLRLFVITLLACVALVWLPAAAFAWSNGPNGADGFGTHDWVLREANRLAAQKNAGWVRLSVALPHTDDPDTIFHDTYYHVYDVWGSQYGNAPKKVVLYYGKALAARKAGNWTAASKMVGIMAHYYADICNPMHTDQSDAEDAIHSPYESDAQRYSDRPGENSSWARFDGYTATRNVTAYTRNTAAASHEQYAALVSGYASEGMSSGVVSITAQSLNRAANGLADLLISIKNRVSGGGVAPAPTPTPTPSPTPTVTPTPTPPPTPYVGVVYITATGEKYHRDGCRYLSQSKIAISLADAKARGYTPCSVCDPPQ
jgi:hypothetical protein